MNYLRFFVKHLLWVVRNPGEVAKYGLRYRLLIVIYGLAVVAACYESGFLQRPAATVAGLAQPSLAADVLMELYPDLPMAKCLEADRLVFLNYDLQTARRLLEDALSNGYKEDESYFYTYATILMLMNENESTVNEAVANWRRNDLTTNDQLDPRVAYRNLELPAPLAPETVHRLVISRDGRKIVFARQDNLLWLYDSNSYNRYRRLPGKSHSNMISAVALAANDTQVVSASLDGDLAVWSLTTGQLIHRLLGHRNDVYDLAVFPDGIRCAAVDRDGMVRIWDLQKGESLVEFAAASQPVSAVAISGNGTILATGSWSGQIKLWDLQADQPTELQQLNGHSGLVTRLVFAPDNKRLVSSSRDATARIWDVVAAREQFVLEGHGAPIYGLDLSRDGKSVVTASEDRRVKIWSADDGSVLQNLGTSPTPRPLYAVLFTPDDRALIWDGGTTGLTFFELAP